MKIFARKPLESLIHIRFLRSSGRALHDLIGHLCSKCTKQDDGATSKSQTTASTCLHGFFTLPCKDDSGAVAKVPGDDGNTEVLNVQSKENGFTSRPIFDDAEMSVLAFDPPRKTSAKHRLKNWISSGHSGMIGRYGNKLELNVVNAPKRFSAELVNTGWPDWLMNVAPEAVQGWLPRRADSFEKLGKVRYRFDDTSFFVWKFSILSLVSANFFQFYLDNCITSFGLQIGQGTYSSVYKARDLRTGKVVALKKVRFVNMDPESVLFMAREICILRKLNHPNVIKLEGIITSSVSQS